MKLACDYSSSENSLPVQSKKEKSKKRKIRGKIFFMVKFNKCD